MDTTSDEYHRRLRAVVDEVAAIIAKPDPKFTWWQRWRARHGWHL